MAPVSSLAHAESSSLARSTSERGSAFRDVQFGQPSADLENFDPLPGAGLFRSRR
jgi:hypothetical protein